GGNKLQMLMGLFEDRKRGATKDSQHDSTRSLNEMKKNELLQILKSEIGTKMTGTNNELIQLIKVGRLLTKPSSPFVFKKKYTRDEILSYDLFNIPLKYLSFIGM